MNRKKRDRRAGFLETAVCLFFLPVLTKAGILVFMKCKRKRNRMNRMNRMNRQGHRVSPGRAVLEAWLRSYIESFPVLPR